MRKSSIERCFDTALRVIVNPDTPEELARSTVGTLFAIVRINKAWFPADPVRHAPQALRSARPTDAHILKVAARIEKFAASYLATRASLPRPKTAHLPANAAPAQSA